MYISSYYHWEVKAFSMMIGNEEIDEGIDDMSAFFDTGASQIKFPAQ